jgi:hypothetical protein
MMSAVSIMFSCPLLSTNGRKTPANRYTIDHWSSAQIRLEEVAMTAWKHRVNVVIWGEHSERLARTTGMLLAPAGYTLSKLRDPYVRWEVASKPGQILYHPEQFREGSCHCRSLQVYEEEQAPDMWLVLDINRSLRWMEY